MANYKHMEMAEALSNDSRINISRGFLGLKTNLTYAPTSSKINLKVNEYAPDMEGRLTQLLQTVRRCVAKWKRVSCPLLRLDLSAWK